MALSTAQPRPCCARSHCSEEWFFRLLASGALSHFHLPQTQTEEEDKRHGIPWACSLSHESFLQPNLTLLTLYTTGMTQASALGHPFLPGPSPLGHLPVLAEGLMEREGGTDLVDPGLVIIVLSPLSSPELLSPEQAHPRTGHQVHFLRESAKVTCSHLLVLIFGAVPG